MPMLRDWVNETRPKTLLLGSTNCALGCALGFYYGQLSMYTLLTALMIVLTGVLLQILCNFANDYGDAFNNADTYQRIGPIRAVMSGQISLTQLRRGMAIVTIASAICGFLAAGLAAYNDLQIMSWFIFLGVISIVAALFYTLGMAYGYKGFGDLAVFVFFGLLAVIGSQVLITAASEAGADYFPDSVYIGCSVGFCSVMLLHIASMRDIDEDKLNNKRTLAVRLGHKGSAIYLVLLFILALGFSAIACISSHKAWELSILAVAFLPLLASTMRSVRHYKNNARIALERKYVAIGVTVHNIGWIILLIVDFWVYY